MILLPKNSPFMPYLLAIKRGWIFVALFGLAAAALAFAIASAIKPEYESHFSYVVSLSQRDDTDNSYRFDGYYALQATDLFAATLAKWVSTPEVIVAAYKEAGIELKTNDPRAISRTVISEKTAPQLVQITVRSQKANEATALVQGLQAVMDKNIDTYHDQGIPAVQFRVVTTPTWQGKVTTQRGAVATATFIFTIFFGINLVLLVEVFRQQRE